MSDKNPPSPIRGLTPPPAPVRKFWWLVAGEVYFHPIGNPSQIQAANVNAIIATDGPAISGKSLGDAQRGLMQAAVDAAPKDAPVQPLQTTVAAISGLGHMSEEEFFGPKVETVQ